jgi:hypothetical protein
VWVADSQSEKKSITPSVVESFSPGDEELPDSIERIVLSAPVAKGLVLHPPAH